MKGKANFLLLGALFAGMAAAATDSQTEGKRWWSHVEYLAADKLEGRDTGSKGHRKAAEYVAGQFQSCGLKPAGTSGYFQSVQFNVRQIDEPNSSLELVRGGKAEPVKLGEEAMFSMRSDPAETVEAQAVFVGYGFAVPELRFDELRGLDLRGKIAVYLAGGPKNIPGPLRAHFQSSAERWKTLSQAGAIGMAMIQNPKSMDIPWSRASLSRFNPSMELAEPALQESRGLRLSLVINPDRADRFFRGSGHTLAELLATADADAPLPKFPLAASFRAKIRVKRSQVESQNVIGLLPGSDSRLKDEYVVLTAHLDHLGVGQPINGDKIYNGAMDDASGVASLLAIACALNESKTSLKRSLLFVAVTAEEKGLLGSKHFVHHPTVNGKNLIADVNMDMYLPLFPLRYLEVQGLNESTLGDDIRVVPGKSGVEIQSDKEPDRNLFVRSNQYRFIQRGIPALAFKFGYLAGSAEQKTAKQWLKNRYHAPSDDANQPVDLVAAAQFNHIILELAERVANQAERPQWKKESFFRRFAG